MVVGSVFAQGIAASVLSHTVLFPPHYYLTVLPALAIITGLGPRRIRARPAGGRWTSGVATAIATVVFLMPLSTAAVWRFGVSTGTTGIPEYSMREGEALASHFWRAGYSFPDLQRHLRGPDSYLLISSAAAFAPGPNGSPERPMADLRILAFTDRYQPEGGLPADGHEVRRGRGRRAWILPSTGGSGSPPHGFASQRSWASIRPNVPTLRPVRSGTSTGTAISPCLRYPESRRPVCGCWACRGRMP